MMKVVVDAIRGGFMGWVSREGLRVRFHFARITIFRACKAVTLGKSSTFSSSEFDLKLKEFRFGYLDKKVVLGLWALGDAL